MRIYFIDYGKQDRRPGEFVWKVALPPLPRDHAFRCLKVSKRFDEDISAVMGAFRIACDGRRVSAARIAYGGMAATPRRAGAAEAALIGADLDDPATWQAARAALAENYTPMDDHRAQRRLSRPRRSKPPDQGAARDRGGRAVRRRVSSTIALRGRRRRSEGRACGCAGLSGTGTAAFATITLPRRQRP